MADVDVDQWLEGWVPGSDRRLRPAIMAVAIFIGQRNQPRAPWVGFEHPTTCSTVRRCTRYARSGTDL